MLFTVYIYINIKHRYLYVCTIYVLGGLGHTFLGGTGPTLARREERRGGDTVRGADGRGSGETRHGKIKAFQGHKGDSGPEGPPPFWNQQSIDTFWLFWSFVQNEST